MEKRILTRDQIDAFRIYLLHEEKSAITVEKYLRDVRNFFIYVNETVGTEKEITKDITLKYKQHLQEQNYAVASINSMLASLNSFLTFVGWSELKVNGLKQQRKIYCPADKELTKTEYMSLLNAAESQPQLHLILQTICGTGIRISELKYFTVEEVREGEVEVRCKNKSRTVLIPGKLKKLLLKYSKKIGITNGRIFVTKNGRPVDRSNIWARMKKLCKSAGVAPSKVFPHNLRKLFARTFYRVEKDIAKLADILGHGSIETTRIYIMSTGLEHRKKIEKLGLIVDSRMGRG